MEIQPNIEIAFMEDFFLLKVRGHGQVVSTFAIHTDVDEIMEDVNKALKDAANYMPKSTLPRFKPGRGR